ncbi:hypothetical protein DFH08DRAFT_873363 [Mycena albidolilacea]|uniref:Uncharacterized protein n=1 Tax=Mycena albidolilacea TaxID=1033008 RepID=A0AAD6ZZ19_9AGAR|nr:hypothetical protein DFH08DRAFT_873363 [Mycena albidolilacea]
MPISHPRRVFRVVQPLSPLFLHALSLHRPANQSPRHALTQSRFIRTFVSKKEGVVHSRRQITAHLHALRNQKATKSTYASSGPVTSVVPTPCASPSTRRSASHQSRTSVALQNRFSVYRDSLPVLSIKTPLPNLISPSNFSSPFTPANQVLHTPFHPPEPLKCTPSKRHRNRNCQWSPLVSLGIDENCPLAYTLDTPESPICDLTRRFSLLAPPSSKRVPRRLSYSQSCMSPWTPESRHSQALASPAMIRSSLWPSSPVTSPRYELDDLQFSPFRVVF